MAYTLLLVLMLVLNIEANLDSLNVEVEYQCIQHCPLQNRTDAGHYDYACDYGCNINQCNKGCKLWRQALNSSCQNSCNGANERLTPKELYCVMGCNDAMTKYFSQLKSKLLTPPPPALVADSLNSASLKLEWNFTEAKRIGLTHHVQWRYEELNADWHYCRNATWNQDRNVVFIENLQPYTKYRFRIVLILGHQDNSIASNPSVVISTLPSGIPVSPPSSVRVTPIDSTHISVSWEPGPFPHGPLLSYVLQITDNQPDSEVHSEVKDIPPENNFYMFRNVRSGRNYTISIRMRNGVGSGPSTEVEVSTPSEPPVKDTQEPILILGTDKAVIELGSFILDEPLILYNSSLLIKGLSVHLSKQLLFVSDSGRHVIKMSLKKKNSDSISYILYPSQINFRPSELSVDWLNDQIYILGEVRTQQHQTTWQIARCNLDGSGLTVAIAGLRIKPYNIEIDPFNGYLFWATQGGSRGGIYRLDISDISNGIKHEVQPEMILNDSSLGAFTVDHTSFHLLVSNQKQNTISMVSIDGKEIVNVRPNVVKSKLQKVVSLATANKKFYWTDGHDVFSEEYHKGDYFHNSYPAKQSSYKKVIIKLQSSQPVPVPINPPTNVQAIFGNNIAKTTWQAPHLLGIQGKAAWQNWSYEIAVKETNTQNFKYHKHINATLYKISGLKQDTEYIVKAAAYTVSGRGPWSSEFRGVTLSSSKNPVIYWSAAKGLFKSDAVGENVETLDQTMDFYFTDMTWYKNQIYLVANDSQVHWYNTETQQQDLLVDIGSVGSIAVDWIGKKLYWSNQKRQLIIRGNLNGTQQEPLPILTLARELNIDSVQAYIYWSTGYGVKCAHLNGADTFEYHPVQLFSGRQVMGLTLDVDHKFVYWIVRGSEGSNLFRAPMAGYSDAKIEVEKISSLQKPNMQGPLCYFHNRLLWLQDDKNAAISNLDGNNIATISTSKSLSDLTLVSVIDPSLHILPEIDEELVVIPESVDGTAVRVTGYINSFNITWNDVENVNYGTVFYEVVINTFARNDSTFVTSYPSIKYSQDVLPFTKLHVAIRAFTYWGTSSQIRTTIYSPASTPSAPRNLRTYVTHQHNLFLTNNISVTLRWDPPTSPNGVLDGYQVYCWYFDESRNRIDICENTTNVAENLQVDLRDLEEDKIYYFCVQGFSSIGYGNISDIVDVNTSVESPLPRLLIASENSIFIRDIDSNKNEPLLHDINTPIEIGYSIKESKLFWINQLQYLMMYNIINSNKTKIVDLTKSAKSLTVDWLERSLYYIQDTSSNLGSTIYKIDLNYIDKGKLKTQQIFSTDYNISRIEVSPYTRKIYWVEGLTLMTCNTDGSDRKPFFFHNTYNKRSIGDNLENDRQCNCTSYSRIDSRSYTLDHSTKTKPLLIFLDADTENVISADRNGCFCNIIASHSVVKTTFPLNQMKSDFGTLYWTNPEGILYALKRDEANIISKRVNVHNILIFGPHMQPFPPKECLSPQQHNNLTVSLNKRTSHSLQLRMPKYKVNENCKETSIATIEYKIYYMQDDAKSKFCANLSCRVETTFEKEFTINNLKPFTKYVIAVAISNYYTDNSEIVVGPPITLQTAVGAPSQPQNVEAKVLCPTVAKVVWSPPEQFNGATVNYEIYWKTEGTVSAIRQKEQLIFEKQTSPNSTQALSTLLNKLSPNETYTIWVRAYSETNETSNDSEKIQIVTYPEPSDLLLVNKTAYTLKLMWNVSPYVEHYNVQYAPLSSNGWLNISVGDRSTGNIMILTDNLTPKTRYKFRFSLRYSEYVKEYIWPADTRFNYETLGDKPSPPGIPIIQYVKPNIYKVWWEASKDNGAPVELYMLEGLKLPNYKSKRSTNRTAFSYMSPSVEVAIREWQSFYNGTNTSWIIDGLSEKYKYEFRVSALNAYGWSDPSDPSTSFDLNEAARMAEKQNPITQIAIAIFLPISVSALIIICICCRKFRKPKKVQAVAVSRGPDVELATLRELPRRGIHNTNVLYVSTQPTTEELTLLPHIRRDQITLTKFLGSGAFGEVFEGKAKGVLNIIGETKVAVKTLKKGASDQEKTEFLQEAQLMSNFKHEHILQLLGVCLDNDPHFIIMELMQEGDLLTYLRTSRNPSIDTPSLTLIELLTMCVDVSKGCRYLEEMHFVHRDLACRNCLVSSKEAEHRIVKIGDFGLARDIYKNDYYRKEGEGLLPVRWMAPESLVDGVFTSQSDVWAFGVLLWEIMTLGQQPYPARNNLEVLHYVRGGGRLGKPIDCPEALHDLMLQCWEFEPDRRPMFKYCLDVLENLHLQNLRSPTTAAHEGQYISTVQEYLEGICNEVYFRDENYNAGEAEDDSNKEKTPFLPPESNNSIPKYLELLYEPEEPSANDGYEIPNEMLHKEDNDSSSQCGNSVQTNKQCNGTTRLDKAKIGDNV